MVSSRFHFYNRASLYMAGDGAPMHVHWPGSKPNSADSYIIYVPISLFRALTCRGALVNTFDISAAASKLLLECIQPRRVYAA